MSQMIRGVLLATVLCVVIATAIAEKDIEHITDLIPEGSLSKDLDQPSLPLQSLTREKRGSAGTRQRGKNHQNRRQRPHRHHSRPTIDRRVDNPYQRWGGWTGNRWNYYQNRRWYPHAHWYPYRYYYKPRRPYVYNNRRVDNPFVAFKQRLNDDLQGYASILG